MHTTTPPWPADGRTTLRTLMSPEAGGGIEVPIVQRDYAQGRPNSARLRRRFVRALFDTLADDSASLDLDYVYGTRSSASGCFIPLDGQQRLTTLFLLHWYLAERAGRRADFRSFGVDAVPGHEQAAALEATAGLVRSRFRYLVRPSSGRFLDGLVSFDLQASLAATTPDTTVTTAIQDQTWYFDAWQTDPSIRGFLAMLDSIHDEARSRGAGAAELDRWYDRLTGPDGITFQLLDPDKERLGEDLYITMNARGKHLESFDIFKSELIGHMRQHLAEVAAYDGAPGPYAGSLAAYYSHALDTRWLNLVWGHLRASLEQANEEDDARAVDALPQATDHGLLNLLRGLILVEVATFGIDAAPEHTETSAGAHEQTALEDLHANIDSDDDEPLVFEDYLRKGCLSARTLKNVARMLDFLAACFQAEDGVPADVFGHYLPWQTLLTRLLRETPAQVSRSGNRRTVRLADGSLTYAERVRFAAWVTVGLEPARYTAGREASLDLAELRDWLRVVHNLSAHEDGRDLLDVLPSQYEAQQRTAPILAWLTEPDHFVWPMSARAHGSARTPRDIQQVEERLKARLILSESTAAHPPSWRSILEAAEQHVYFRGSLSYLFEDEALFEAGAPLPSKAGLRTALRGRDLIFPPKSPDGKRRSRSGVRPELHQIDELLLERALLRRGDYTAQFSRSKNHRSLFRTATSNGSIKSWLAALREGGERRTHRHLRGLLREVGAAIPHPGTDDTSDAWPELRAWLQADLTRAVVADPTDQFGWRRMLLSCPSALRYAWQGIVRAVPKQGGLYDVLVLKGRGEQGYLTTVRVLQVREALTRAGASFGPELPVIPATMGNGAFHRVVLATWRDDELPNTPEAANPLFRERAYVAVLNHDSRYFICLRPDPRAPWLRRYRTVATEAEAVSGALRLLHHLDDTTHWNDWDQAVDRPTKGDS